MLAGPDWRLLADRANDEVMLTVSKPRPLPAGAPGGTVELALNRLAEHEVVDLDEERKAAMVSNLLVVLCGDRDTQPVVNTGSLYS